MTQRVFFGFDHQDIADGRAAGLKQLLGTQSTWESVGFFEPAAWSAAEAAGEAAVKKLIDGAIEGASVTCILIGSETHAQRWVRYQIMRSLKRGNRLIGIHVNAVADASGLTRPAGPSPFDSVGVSYSEDGTRLTLVEHKQSGWSQYTDVDGNPSWWVTPPVDPKYRAKGFLLSHWVRVYDWMDDDGASHFFSWLG